MASNGRFRAQIRFETRFTGASTHVGLVVPAWNSRQKITISTAKLPPAILARLAQAPLPYRCHAQVKLDATTAAELAFSHWEPEEGQIIAAGATTIEIIKPPLKLPRHAHGSDHGCERKLVAQRGTLQLYWTPGQKVWSGTLTGSRYRCGTLDIADSHDPRARKAWFRPEVEEPRLSRLLRRADAQQWIGEHLGLSTEVIAQLSERHTVIAPGVSP